MNSVIAAPRGRKGFLTGLCRAAAVLLLALTAWPEAARAQLFYAPVVGSPKVGNTLTVDTSLQNVGVGQSLRYQWYAVPEVVIEGATSKSYTIEEAQLGNRLKVRVGWYSGDQIIIEFDSLDTAVVLAAGTANQRPEGGPIFINLAEWPSETSRGGEPDDLRVGDWVQEFGGNIEDPDGDGNLRAARESHLNYAWLADDVPVKQGGRGYRLKPADAGKRITLRFTFTDSGGVVENPTSYAYGPVRWRVAATGQPTITGRYRVGDTLTAGTSEVNEPDGIDAASLGYQWLADDVAIANATGATYTLTGSEENKRIKVRVSFNDGAGDAETLTSAATGAVRAAGTQNRAVTGTVAISGAPRPGSTLRATPQVSDADGTTRSQFSYQWLADSAVISGATGTRYAVKDADAGKRISVRLTFTDDGGFVEMITSAQTETVRAGAAPTGRPGISGRHRVGDLLTAIIGDIGDPDGVDRTTFAYQWLANDAQISNATSKSYTLAAAQLGQRIKVRVTFTDGGGTQETLTSLATSAVVAAGTANQAPTGLPTISGTARVDQTLTANTGGIADADGLTGVRYAYEWLVDDMEVFGGAGRAYTVTSSDAGKRIKVRVTFTDDRGYVEILTSAETATVPAQASDGDVRLERDGRLFMYRNGGWGTVCDDGLAGMPGERLAQVVCRQLGRTGGTRLPYPSQVYYGPEGVRFDRVSCAGTESRVGDCTFRYSTNIPCDHSEDVIISCTDETVSRPSFLVIISGTRRVGEVLTTQFPYFEDYVGSIAYQWFVDRLAVTGATSTTYTVKASDQGSRIHVGVVVTWVDDFPPTSYSSARTRPVLPVLPLPTITGTALVGKTLTADTSGILDPDEPTVPVFTYQWLAGGEAISTATAKTYTVMTRDVGKRVAVQVSFTDEDGNEETLTSASTAEVAAGENTAAVTVGFRPVSPMPTAVEGGSGALVAVDVSPAPNGSLFIPITATGGGGAEAGDFTVSQATLTFNSGETAKHVTVTAVDDAVDDDGETVTLGFGTLPSSASTVGALQTTITVGLTDNDERGVRVSKESMTVPEGGRGSYTVVLGSEPTAAVTVTVTVTADLADTGLEVEPASLTFTGTSWTVAQTVTVIAAEDDNAVVEPVVTLAHAAAGGDYEGAEVAGVAVTVTENDTPALAIADARGGEDAGVLKFVVSLSVASSKTVTVNYATADGTATAGSDYTGASGVLTFAPGVTDSQTIEVQITDDAADDEVEAETFTVGLSGAANATLQDATGTGTIDDDDDPAVTVAFGAASYTAAEGGSGATVVLSLSADPERTVEIPLTAAAGGDAAAGDYEVSAQAVTFAPGETAKHVTVTAVDDAVDDEGESVTLGFGALPPGVTAGSVTAAVVALEDNDERGVRVSKESMTVPEGGRGSYTVVLGSEPTAAVTVTVTVTADLADTGLEVEPASLTFTGTSWTVAQTVTVIAAEDDNAVVEPVVTLAHAAAGGDYEGAEVAGVAVTVTENDTPALAIADARGGEDAGVLKFVVSLSVASSKTVTVNYATADGTATAGSDYTGASGVLTFAPGVTDSQTIEVQITDDAADDEVEAETFTVGLSGAANATLQDATGTGTIDDDDDPAVTVAFGAASYRAAEGGSGATVVLSLSADPERTVEIPLTAAAGGDAAAGDYEVSAQAVTFAPGETAKHVTVTAVDDAVDDEGESVTLGFGALPPGVTAGSVTAAVVALEDNDERGVRVSKESMTVPEGGRGSYTVVLGSEPTAAVTVTVTVTADLADTGLEVEPASLTFTGTSWTVAQTVTVIAAEDDNAVVEPVVTLAHAAAGGDYEGAEVAGVAVTVTENDTPALAIADARGGEDAGVLKFVVSLSVASSKTVTVNYATADGTATAGSDYTGASGVLTFAPGVTDSQTIEVQITDDAADDEVEAETFTVGLSGAANATLQDATGTGTIDDDDDPAVTVAFGAASYTAAEGGSGATVVLSLSADPERTVEIPLTAAAGGDAAAGDYEVSAQAVTFAPGETAKHVTVTAVDDAVDDEGESVTLGFGALPPGVTAGSVTAAVVALEDNDERGVRVSKESMTVPEGGRGSYTVVLGSEPTAAVTVTVTADLADTGLEVEPASLTFTGTSWTVAQTVTVIAAEDDNAVVEPVVTLAHAAAGGDYEGAEVAGVAVTVVENDVPTLAIGDARGREDAGVLEFVVSLSAASSNTVTVNYATADGTATAGSDYTGASGVLTFAPGVTDSQTIEVQIMDDAADDEVEAETFTVTLSGATNAELAVASATGTIEDDDDPAVTVAFGAASYRAAEGGGDAVVAVTLSADPERTVEIPLTAAAGGGAAAGDYRLSARTLTFESGATAREVRVTAVEDAVDDDGESVTLGFDALELPAGVTAGSVTAAVVALEDNDERGVTVLPASLTVTEGGAAENYTVVLGSEPTGAVTVSVTTDLADTSVRVDPASLTFTAADWSTAQSVAVKAAEDDNAVVEPVVTLAHAAAGGDYEGAEVAGVAVTVVENDTATLAIGDARGREDAGVLEFVVSLSAASSNTVTVNYATADGTATAGSDYTGASGVLTFAPGVTDSQTIEVEIMDDAADDEVEAETFTVTLSGATNAELAVASATGTIEDDDDPAVTVAFGAASYTAAEGGGDAVVAVTLSADPERTVEIPLTAAAGGGAAAGDYRLSARTLTFESGATAREVRVTAVEDAVDDDGESVTLGFDALELPAGVTAGSVTAAVVALEDNDERGVTVLPASLTVTEGGAAENYTVVLGSEPTGAVTVSVTTDLADTSVRVDPASLTFTAADWSTAQSVAVKAAEDEDALAEPVVTLAHVASGGDYSGAAVSGVAVTVVENDVPRLAVADATGAEGAGVLHFVVSLSAASSNTVTVNYATVDGTAVAGADYEPVSGRLTFTPGSAGSRTIEVSITDDAEAEDAETFTVELSGETNAVLGQASATGTIVDDDALNTPPAAVGVIEEQELTVGGEAARVDVSNAFADAEGDRLTYTAETADAEVATVRVAGTTVTVVPAGIGRTTVTVTASDSNAEATQRFVVVVGVVVGDAAVRPTADGGAVVVLTVPEAPTVRIEVPGGSEALDTDGDGDVDGQDELPTVRAVSSAAVPAVPAALRVRVDTESAVDIEVPEQLTANGARVRVCLATSLDSERLALYRYDAEAQEWQRLESAVEQRGEQRFVCAEVGDFSVFAVFEERADVPGADVNGDGRIDGDDALVMYYAYTSSSLLGDGETGGVGRFRRALLAGRAGNPNPSDADLMAMLRRANAWRGAGADAGGDVNGDGRIDGDDALVMYYAYTSSSLLGDGETGGVGRFRQTLLAGRAGSANPSDADLMEMLRRANDLTERLR